LDFTSVVNYNPFNTENQVFNIMHDGGYPFNVYWFKKVLKYKLSDLFSLIYIMLDIAAWYICDSWICMGIYDGVNDMWNVQ
jgi:hypothetical protein